jgi:hypothetical protein
MLRGPRWTLVVAALAGACGDKLVCGEGTREVDGACIASSSDADTGAVTDTGETVADGLDKDEDGFTTPTDCDDGDPAVHPEANEYCDGIDNDCDGQTDEADAVNAGTYYTDADGDGFGDPAAPVAACEMPEGTVEDATDCDDSADSAYPGAEEVWYDGIDNDCLGGTDDDVDGDGHVGNAEGTGVDCDDADAEVHPDAEELCGDGIDNNCDGDLAACRLSGPLSGDLANARLFGPDHDAWGGESIALSGDLNGDGVGDVVVGAPRDDAGGVNAGAVYVVPGTVSGVGGMAERGQRIAGAQAGAMSGSVLVVGDVDGDGADDLLVGTPLAGWTYEMVVTGDTGDTGDMLLTTTVERVGSLAILLGPLAPEAALATADATLVGWEVDHGVGSALAVIGDQDGDGAAELVIGLPGDDAQDTDAGAVRILPGPIGRDASFTASFLLSGDTAGDRAGASVASAGDLNGDGIDDLLVAAPGFDASPPGGGDPAADAGAVYVFLGPILRDRFLGDSDGMHLGVDANDAAGTTLSSADFDGDGTSDFAVGAPGVDGDATDIGTVYVVAGPGTTRSPLAVATVQLVGTEGGAQAGVAMAVAGDVDGDGQVDILVGQPRSSASAGRVSLIHGPLAGIIGLDDADVSITGTATNQRLGTSIAGGVDVSGDGIDDIAVGAPGDDTTGDGGGAALIFFGSGS